MPQRNIPTDDEMSELGEIALWRANGLEWRDIADVMKLPLDHVRHMICHFGAAFWRLFARDPVSGLTIRTRKTTQPVRRAHAAGSGKLSP